MKFARMPENQANTLRIGDEVFIRIMHAGSPRFMPAKVIEHGKTLLGPNHMHSSDVEELTIKVRSIFGHEQTHSSQVGIRETAWFARHGSAPEDSHYTFTGLYVPSEKSERTEEGDPVESAGVMVTVKVFLPAGHFTLDEKGQAMKEGAGEDLRQSIFRALIDNDASPAVRLASKPVANLRATVADRTTGRYVGTGAPFTSTAVAFVDSDLRDRSGLTVEEA